MGMFDSVWVRCCICGNKIEFQSKGGPCQLRDYDAENVPADVASSLTQEKTCGTCNTVLRVMTTTPQTVRAWTIKASDAKGEEDDDGD